MARIAAAEDPQDKKQVGIKLTYTARQLRQELSRKLGIDKTAVVELALRELADRHNVSVDESEKKR